MILDVFDASRSN